MFLFSLCTAGKVIRHGIGGGHKQRYRMIDFQRLRCEPGKEDQPIVEKVVEVRYDPCRSVTVDPMKVCHLLCSHLTPSLIRSADIALVAGGSRKRWIIATENMEAGDVIKTSGTIGRIAVLANEGDSHPLGALPVGTLINNLEMYPGKGAQYIRAAGMTHHPGFVIRDQCKI